MMNKLICITGPTASGKTGLAIKLAHELGTEIISSDSMQLYRYMDIGTAKPTMEEREGIPHHMLDVIDPCEDYSAARYAEEAGRIAENMLARGLVPIVAGGTGLYLDALTGSRSFEDEPDDPDIRKKLQDEAAELGNAVMHARLESIDPESAARIHENDQKRTLRALEIYLLTGETATERNRRAAARPPRFETIKICLDWPDREALYSRIDRRVELMMEQGLAYEAKRIRAMSPGHTASQAIGYKELFRAFDGLCTLDEAKEDIARESRRYAKRQLTWFRRDKDMKWITADDPDACFSAAKAYIFENL